MNFRVIGITVLILVFTGIVHAQTEAGGGERQQNYVDLTQFKWMHGAESCKQDTDPKLQIVQANVNTYVIRQNKCVTFEAPFIYVLVGQEYVLVVDTGANESTDDSPLYAAVRSIMDTQVQRANPRKILVVHTHSHGDHIKGDEQFRGMDGVELVGTSQDALEEQLGLEDWPNSSAKIELGGRPVTVIPIPGHQEQSIALFDHQSGWLLTGDSFYPGLIMVRDWQAYQASIERLVEFSQTHTVSMILGSHIEMNGETSEIYPIGSTYQPNELPLALTVAGLHELNQSLRQTPKAQSLEFKNFIISPLSRLQKVLGNLLSSK